MEQESNTPLLDGIMNHHLSSIMSKFGPKQYYTFADTAWIEHGEVFNFAGGEGEARPHKDKRKPVIHIHDGGYSLHYHPASLWKFYDYKKGKCTFHMGYRITDIDDLSCLNLSYFEYGMSEQGEKFDVLLIPTVLKTTDLVICDVEIKVHNLNEE